MSSDEEDAEQKSRLAPPPADGSDDDADVRPPPRRVPPPPPRHHIGECEEGGGRPAGRPDDVPAPFAALPYPLYRSGEKQTSLEATLNLLNNLLGAGLLVMPRAFAEAGIISGLIVMGLMALANKYTLLLVLRMSGSTLEEEPSYPEIGKRVFGQQGLVLVLSAYLLFTGGVLVGYLIALVDIFSELPAIKGAPRFILVCVALMVCTPGATLKSLRHVALLSGVCMAGVCVLVVVLTMACIGDVLSSEVVTAADVAWIRLEPRGLFAAAALFALQFSVQAGGIEVLTNLQAEPEEDDEAHDMHDSAGLSVAEGVSRTSYIIATAISAVIGCAGYMRFGDTVKGDVLLNFDPLQHAGVLTVTRICYAFVVTSSFAFIMVPCRHAMLDVFALRNRNNGDAEALTDDSFMRSTAVILITCGCLAWLVSDLASLFKFVGVWATMALAFVLPCGFFMELQRRREGTRLLSPLNALPLLLVAFGLAVVASSAIDYIFGFHEAQPGYRGQREVVQDPTQSFGPTVSDHIGDTSVALGEHTTVIVENPAITT